MLGLPPAQPGTTRNRLTLLALWLLFYATFTLTSPPLLDDADSVHAEVAREILLRHDWVTLYANGIRYLEKAPLLYWSMAASMRVFGVSAPAARLPLALTVLALALTLESFARRAFDSARAGLYAALISLSSFGIFIFTRITIPDAAVCLWITLALYCYWRNTRLAQPSRLLCYSFAACCALNVLTKGLIGIVFPVGIVLLHLLALDGLRNLLRNLRALYPITSIAVFLDLAVPWHIFASRANPTEGHPAPITFTHGHWLVPLPTQGNVHGWTWFYFVNEHLLRYLNLRVPRDYDTVPLLLFYALLFVWLMPWSAFLPHALATIPLRKLWRLHRRASTSQPHQQASAPPHHHQASLLPSLRAAKASASSILTYTPQKPAKSKDTAAADPSLTSTPQNPVILSEGAAESKDPDNLRPTHTAPALSATPPNPAISKDTAATNPSLTSNPQNPVILSEGAAESKDPDTLHPTHTTSALSATHPNPTTPKDKAAADPSLTYTLQNPVILSEGAAESKDPDTLHPAHTASAPSATPPNPAIPKDTAEADPSLTSTPKNPVILSEGAAESKDPETLHPTHTASALSATSPNPAISKDTAATNPSLTSTPQNPVILSEGAAESKDPATLRPTHTASALSATSPNPTTLTPLDQTRLLLGLWAATVMLFFSFSTRQEYYVLPALPALILLIAGWLHDEADEAETFSLGQNLLRSGQRIGLTLFVLGALAALAAAFLALTSHPPRPGVDLSVLLKQNPGDYALSFGHFLDLNRRALGAFRAPLLLTAFALGLGTLVSWRLRREFLPHPANLTLAAAAFLFLLAAHQGLRIFSPVLTSQQLATAIEPQLKPPGSRFPDIIVINGEYEAASTLGFYLHRPSAYTTLSRYACSPPQFAGEHQPPAAPTLCAVDPIHILNGRSSNLWYGSFFPDAPPLFETDLSLRLLWSGDRRVFLWTEPEHVPNLPGHSYLIAQSGGKEILSNQPNPF